MTHDNAYVRTDDERRADWSCVQQITPDNRAIVARLVELEDERVHLLALVHKQGNTIAVLQDEKKRRAV